MSHRVKQRKSFLHAFICKINTAVRDVTSNKYLPPNHPWHMVQSFLHWSTISLLKFSRWLLIVSQLKQSKLQSTATFSHHIKWQMLMPEGQQFFLFKCSSLNKLVMTNHVSSKTDQNSCMHKNAKYPYNCYSAICFITLINYLASIIISAHPCCHSSQSTTSH